MIKAIQLAQEITGQEYNQSIGSNQGFSKFIFWLSSS